MSAVAENGAGTWLVMLRDVSDSVRVAGQRRVMAALALDADTGLARGFSMAASGRKALTEAFGAGRTRPAGPLPPGRPERILCSGAIVDDVSRTLAELFDHGAAPPVEEIVNAFEAEDIFDSFLGHMAGRNQPAELATPDDWAMFFEVSRRYTEAEPWTRWSDINRLHLDLRLRSQETRYLALVLGNEGIQRGLVLYPGETLPTGLSEAVPASQVNLPPGTLNFYLDPTREAPPEYVGKALRYGWPGDSKLIPLYMAIGEGGAPFDLGLADVQRITLALAAVLKHDARGLVVEGESAASSGLVTLSDGGTGTFAIRQAPAEESLDEGVRLRTHQVALDLVPEDASVVIGSMPWPVLTELRREARIYRAVPPTAPPPSGDDVPLVAILPRRKDGDRIAAQIAGDDPYGISIVEDKGQALVTLVCAHAAQLLTEFPADASARALYERHIHATDGVHVVMVADESTTRGKGNVYGLFECHQPLAPLEG
jgi:hypothetical protein